MTYSPPPSADAVAVFGLLSIIADPEAAKARMVELEAVRSSAEEAQEKHRVTLNEVREATEANNNTLVKRERDIAERKAEIDNKQMSLSIAIAEHNAKVQALREERAQFAQQANEAAQAHSDRTSALNKREADLNTHENDLKAREANLNDRGAKVAAVLDEAHAIKADYERKSAALQKALK